MFTTRAPEGKSMPKKKMSDQPLWQGSALTGVASMPTG